MSVIGRLDDQVNEIIIKPIGAGRESAQSEEPPTPPQETSRPPQRVTEEESAQDEGRTRPSTSELPVWLL